MVSLEKLSVVALVICIAAVGAAVKWFAIRHQTQRLSLKQRTQMIVAYMAGATLLFDFVFFFLLEKKLGSLVFVPIAAFTMWMGYAMAALVLKVRKDAAGQLGSTRGFAIPFGLSMMAFAALTAGALAYAIFQS